MIGRKKMDLVERILAALDKCQEVEDYAIDEIEVLPIEVVNARLQELEVDPTVPPAIMNFVRRANTPAQRVIDALYEHDSEEDEQDEIEHLDLNKVQAALHDAGLNYRAGVERIRQLTGASNHSEEPESPIPVGEVSENRQVFHQPAKPKRVLPWKGVIILAAVAAIACLFIVDKNASSLKLENAALHREVVALAEAPLIRAEDVPIKVLPEQPGGMDVPNRDILVYGRMRGTPGEKPAIEHLLPEPEQPLTPPAAVARPADVAQAPRRLSFVGPAMVSAAPESPTTVVNRVPVQLYAKDDAQASDWYRKAAEQGDASAQYKLGWMYEKGRGVAKDDAQASDWYRKAAEQGQQDAEDALKRLGL